MILCRRLRFVFIKGAKVAGTSVEIALSRLCDEGDIVTPVSTPDEITRLALGAAPRNWIGDEREERAYVEATLKIAEGAGLGAIPHANGRYYNHMPLTEVIGHVGDISDYRVAFVERCPYAKAISWANHSLTKPGYRISGKMRESIRGVEEKVLQGLDTGGLKAAYNLPRYLWPDGTLAGAPIRYEHLGNDYVDFVRSLGVASVPELPHVKKGVMASGYDPRTLLGADAIGGINAMFADEFEAFGYEMLEPKRNRVL